MICPYGLNGETRPVKIHSRRYLCGLFLSLPLFLAVARSAGSEDADPFPPASPGTETVVPGDLPFVTDCLSQVNEIAANNGWKLGTQLLTHSDQWGTILRVDFDIAGYTVSARINRAVCWRTAGGDLNIMYMCRRCTGRSSARSWRSSFSARASASITLWGRDHRSPLASLLDPWRTALQTRSSASPCR